jgi:hypothetical protein
VEIAGGIVGGLVVGLIVGIILKSSQIKAKAGGAAHLDVALKLASKASQDAAFAKKVNELFNPPPPKPSGEAVRILAILQRESRILDFLMENLQPYTDDQIGASVRDIQQKAQTAIKKHLTLEPVLPQEEGASVTVASGFDPSAILLVGNVTGNPPFKGSLKHGGWRAKNVNIPKPPEGADEFVLMPAEVELT